VVLGWRVQPLCRRWASHWQLLSKRLG